MSERVGRRQFVKAGAAASVAATVDRAAFAQAPTVLVRKAAPPVVIASGNGHTVKNGGPRSCVEEAFSRIVRGEDVLDAIASARTGAQDRPAEPVSITSITISES